MKTLSTIVFITLSIWSFSQPTGNIEKDTALANQYYQEASILIANDDTTNLINLLEKAIVLYEAHPFDKQLAILKGKRLSFIKDRHIYKEDAEALIALVEKELPHLEKPAFLVAAYVVLTEYYLLQDFVLAEKYALKTMELFDETSKSYFDSAIGLGLIFSQTGNLEGLKNLVAQLENILDNQKNDKLERYRIIVYKTKTEIYSLMGNYEEVIVFYKKMFEDNEKYNVFDAETLAPMYMNLGIYYGELGAFDEAIKWAKKSIATTTLPKDSPRLGSFYGNIAYIYFQKKDYQSAAENNQKAIDYFELDSANSKAQLQFYYTNLATAFISLKQFDKGILALKKSKKYGENINQIHTLGGLYQKQEKYELASVELQKVLIASSTNFNDSDIYKNPSIYDTYQYLLYAKAASSLKGKNLYLWGKATKDKTKIEASLEAFQLCIRLHEISLKKVKTSDKSTFKITKTIKKMLDAMINSQYFLYQLEPSKQSFEALLELSEKRKAIQLIETLTPSPLPDNIYEQEQVLLKIIQEIGLKLDLANASQQTDSINFYQNTFFEANEVIQEFWNDIDQKHPKRTNYDFQEKYVGTDKIQQSLSNKTLLVAYNLVGKEAFILTTGSSNYKIGTTDITNLKANIQKFNELIQDPFAFQNSIRNEFIEVSHDLYNQLIKPIESELEGKTELMIVVEGQLFSLPFELLLKSNEKKPYHELDFLIKKYAINYHYSATAFLKLQEKETVKDNSLLAFAPVFSKGEELNETTRSLDFLIDSLYNGIDGNEFVALPSTKKEVNTIAKIVKSNNGQATVLLQKKATKDNFAQQLESQSYQFVHIATHGLVNFKNPRLSALACYSKDETMDNLMYANEIQFKNINADLVVLSSCESGIGQLVEGEGLIALNRSFIYSGAKNVIFSLWKVSDTHSSELMIDFYENYFDNQSYTTALRNAKLNMLANPTSAQPKYWSAFVLMGE